MKPHSDGLRGDELSEEGSAVAEILTDKNWPFSKPIDDPQLKAWEAIDPIIGRLSSAKRKRNLGRPPKPTENTTRIHTTWMKMGKPLKWGGDLAFAAYGSKYTQADGPERKKLRGICARAVERIEAKLATKSKSK